MTLKQHNQQEFNWLAIAFIAVDEEAERKKREIFKEMEKIAAKTEIAKAVGVDRKTLYNKFKWKKDDRQ